MNGSLEESTFLGDVHLITQLVDVATASSSSAVATTSKQSVASANATTTTNTSNNATIPPSTVTSNDIVLAADCSSSGGGNNSYNNNKLATPLSSPPSLTAYMKYTVHRATAMHTWWPTKLLSTRISSGNGSSNNNITALSHVQQQQSVGSNLLIGYLQCGFQSLLIELSPSAGGLLFNCKECNSADGTITVSWDNVRKYIHIYMIYKAIYIYYLLASNNFLPNVIIV